LAEPWLGWGWKRRWHTRGKLNLEAWFVEMETYRCMETKEERLSLLVYSFQYSNYGDLWI